MLLLLHLSLQFCLKLSTPPFAAKDQIVAQLLAVKAKAGVTFDSISAAIGLTNVQAADIFFRQVGPYLFHTMRHMRILYDRALSNQVWMDGPLSH